MTPPTLPGNKFINITGMILVVLGILSILAPVIVGSAIVIFIGGILLLAGITQILQGILDKMSGNRWLSFVLGIIATVSGILVIGQPLLGLTFLTLLLVAYFIADGFCKIYISFQLRHIPSWSWLSLSGVLSLVLGLLIWSDWPLSKLWAVGVLVGVNLLVTGITMMFLAASIRTLMKS